MDDVAAIREQVTRRRERLGMNITDLAAEAGISRDTLGDFEAGKKGFHASTLGKVTRALERAEMEAFGATGEDVPPPPIVRPIGDPAEQLLEVEVVGRGGFRMIVRGPVDNPEALADMADRLLRRMSSQPDDEPQAD